MIRVNACGIIALVAYEKTIGDGAKMNLIRESMCQKMTPASRCPQFAVPARCFVISPEPAGIGFPNLCPETLFGRNPGILSGHHNLQLWCHAGGWCKQCAGIS